MGARVRAHILYIERDERGSEETGAKKPSPSGRVDVPLPVVLSRCAAARRAIFREVVSPAAAYDRPSRVHVYVGGFETECVTTRSRLRIRSDTPV